MLPNEEFALACRAYYEEQGLIVDATNGQFAHCPLPKGMGETGYYLLWEHHQHQGLLQSKDVGRRCFWSGHAKKWLQQSSYWPDNYFELWDIYEQFRHYDVSREVEIWFPGGEKKLFSSVKEAAAYIGADANVVSTWARRKITASQRKFRGFFARYV